MAKKTIDEKAFPLNLGENLRGKLDDNILTLQMDLSQEGVVSNSGKSKIIAGTGGNMKVGTGALEAKLGLNLYRAITKA